MKNRVTGVLTLFAVLLMTLVFVSSSFSMGSEVSPSRIAVNSLYHGSKIKVTGEAGAGDDIIIKFSSPEKKVHLRQKGKKGGLLWMNVGELEFDPVSDVSLVYSTQEIDTILSDEQQDRYALGFDAFRRTVDVSPVSGEAEKEKWLDEFLRFKEDNMVYGEFAGSISTSVDGDKKTYELTVDWPYQAPPQEYAVTVYAVSNGSVQGHEQIPLPVETVGVLKFISGMAFNMASVYGIASILIAVVAGFVVSVIFKGGGGAH